MYEFSNMNSRIFYLLIIWSYLFLLGIGDNLQAQDCSTLYVLTESDGQIYSINVNTGSKTSVTSLSGQIDNLAVGPDPSNTSNIVFTHVDGLLGSTVFKDGSSIGTTAPTDLNGIGANPATSGATAGYVYGINTSRQLVQVSPAPAANLGTITGDATWSSATVGGDVFFDDSDNLITIVSVGSSDYLYNIDIGTLTATQVVQFSGSLPPSYDAIAFLGDKIYVGDVYSTTSGFILTRTTTYHIQLYEINANSGQSTQRASVTFGSSNLDNIDFATCVAFTPPAGPTCNELFGIDSDQQTVYKINLATLSLSLSASTSNNYGNLAFGPITSNLNQNQFVVSRNNNSGNIFVAQNGAGTFTDSGNTWGSPIGIGTDPASGIIYGISSKDLTSWSGSGNATSLGIVTGDATWTSGTTLNDIAVDAGGNLYSFLFNGANTYLYRIDPITFTATQVVQATGDYITNGTSLNGNGMAYLGDYFYYSRLDTRDEDCGFLCTNTILFTDLWRLNAYTGVSEYLGRIDNFQFGDLASCATVTKVPADFAFNCSDPSAGLQINTLTANGTTQEDILIIPVTGSITGLAQFTVTSAGISTSPSPYEVNIEQGVDSINIPITYNGSGSSGSQSLTVTTDISGTGTCNMSISIAEADTDGDGVVDSAEAAGEENDPCLPTQSASYAGYNAANAIWRAADCDGDGVTNGTEADNSTAPYDTCSLNIADVTLTATSTGDCDGDGVTDATEINGTDNNPATTGDNTDPTDPCDYNTGDKTLTTSGTWNAGDCDGDGNPNSTDPNVLVATATDDMGTANIGATTSIDILGNDDFLANDGNTIMQTGGTAGGTVSFDPITGNMDYTPLAGEANSMVTVVYQVCQGAVCDDATVTITVPQNCNAGAIAPIIIKN